MTINRRPLYEAQRERIDLLVEKISEGLDGHAECFDADPANFGYLGDLMDIERVLRDLSDRLWSEGEYAS